MYTRKNRGHSIPQPHSLNSLCFDILSLIASSLDPLSLLYLASTGKALYQSANNNHIWQNNLASFFPSATMSYIKRFYGMNFRQKFSFFLKERYSYFNQSLRSHFVLAEFGHTYTIINTNISYNMPLLETCNKETSLLHLIRKNNDASLNQYIFDQLCAKYLFSNRRGLLLYGIKLDQSGENFEKLFTPYFKTKINDIEFQPYTLLHWSVQYNSINTARFLLKANASPDRGSTNLDFLPMLISIQTGQLNMVKLLHKYKANVGPAPGVLGSPLHYAMEHGEVDIARFLLKERADTGINYQNFYSPLLAGVDKGHFPAVKMLLEYHKENNLQLENLCEDRGLALYTAAFNGHEKICKLLLEHGMNTEVQVTGHTPLYVATENGHCHVAETLIKYGANCDHFYENASVLYKAAEKGHESIVKLICEKSLLTLDHSCDDHTPLQMAAKNGHYAVVKILLEKGAAIYTNQGPDPFCLAMQNGHICLAKLPLNSKKIDVNRPSGHMNMTLLHTCAEHEKLESCFSFAMSLIKAGANPLVMTTDGRTPSSFAKNKIIKQIFHDLEHIARCGSEGLYQLNFLPDVDISSLLSNMKAYVETLPDMIGHYRKTEKLQMLSQINVLENLRTLGPFGQMIFLCALLEKNKEKGPNNIMTAFLDNDLITGTLIKHIENKALLQKIRETIVLPILNGLNQCQNFHSKAYAIPLLYIFYLEHQIAKAPALEIEQDKALEFKK